VILHDPDVLLIDLVFPGGSGLDAAREVVARHPRTRVVVLTGSAAPEALVEALRIGVAGYLRKDQEVPEIAAALEAVASGQSALDPALLKQVNRTAAVIPRQRRPHDLLTARERSVAAMLVDGLNTDEIMRRLGVSQSTVRTHVQSILTKLGVHTRLQAVTMLAAQGRDLAGERDVVAG
jgi:two-component system, NarL family, nitrate/nitrite response regulator NarL